MGQVIQVSVVSESRESHVSEWIKIKVSQASESSDCWSESGEWVNWDKKAIQVE